MEKVRKVVFHGPLQKRFGDGFSTVASDVKSVLEMAFAQFPGFEDEVRRSAGLGFVQTGENNWAQPIAADGLSFNFSDKADQIHIGTSLDGQWVQVAWVVVAAIVAAVVVSSMTPTPEAQKE